MAMRAQPSPSSLGSAVGALIAFAVAMAVYARTMLPGLGFWDTGEFQTVAHVLGIAHPTGYPLYILLGKAFTWWPWGSVAFRMNLMSAVCAAGTAALLVLWARRLGVRPGIALAGALAFAFAGNVWRTANHADPHTLHVLIVAVLWGLAMAWARSGAGGWLYLLAFGMGLGLGNHMLLVFELPALVLYAVGSRLEAFKSPRSLLLTLLAGLGGLAVYLYLPLRAAMAPPLNYADPRTWERFVYVVTGQQFQTQLGFLSREGLATSLGRMPEVAAWHAQWWTLPGAGLIAALALVGGIALWRREPLLALAMGLGMLLPAYMASTYANADLSRYYFVPCLILLAFACCGAECLVAAARPVRWTEWPLVALSLLLVPVHFGTVDAHQDREAERYVSSLFERVRRDAVIVSWWSYSTPLWYARHVEGRRRDVSVLDESDLVQRGWDAERAIETHLGARPVYVILMPDAVRRLQGRYALRRLPPVTRYDQEVYEVLGPLAAPVDVGRPHAPGVDDKGQADG